MLFIGQDICRQPQATAGQHRDETVLTEGTDDAIEGHGRDMTDRRAPFQTETAVGGQQGVPSHVGSHLAVAQDEMGQYGKNSLASRALHAPDGKAAQADSHIMGVASQALIMAPATLSSLAYSTARRGGLRGVGGISTDAKMAANIDRGFCPKNRSAAVVPSGRVRKKLCTVVKHARFLGWASPRSW